MNDEILRKIKRCMDLSSSSNEHEAALALKQMQALLQKHNLTEKHVKAFGVTERSYELSVKKPAQWVLTLHNTISQALDCASLIQRYENSSSELIFIGEGSTPEIATYAFEVLFRSLKQNRSDYIEYRLYRFKRTNKTKLADAYCAGWVNNVYSKVKNLNPNQEIKEKIKAYTETKLEGYDPAIAFEGLNRFSRDDDKAVKAMIDGYKQSKDVNLFAAAGHKAVKQIGGGS